MDVLNLETNGKARIEKSRVKSIPVEPFEVNYPIYMVKSYPRRTRKYFVYPKENRCRTRTA